MTDEMRQVSIKIQKELWEKWKATGLRAGHVFKLGMQAVDDNPQLIKRISSVEMSLKGLEYKMHESFRQIAELQTELKKQGEKNASQTNN